jgi:trehalose 6-phosphate phosphatase
MKDILAKANVDVLAQFARSNVLVAFDYDGTLAPIVDDPEEARMRPETREHLTSLNRLYPCVVISGRAQADVLKRIRGAGVLEAIGNHGLEPWRRNEELSACVQEWLVPLREKLAPIQGVKIEDKLFSIAIHFRQSTEQRAAHEAILAAARELEGVRILGGKLVVNLLPQGAPHKGTALMAARERLHCDTAIYVGDDETDEDVFSLEEPGLLGIRVGQVDSSRASFCIREQENIDELLQALISFRPEADGHVRAGA